MADYAGLGLTTIQLCLQLGVQIYKACEAYRHADETTYELTLSLRNVIARTNSQTKAVANYYDKLDTEVIDLHNDNMKLLRNKLETVLERLHRMANRGAVKGKIELVFVKNSLEKSVRELIDWSTLFEPLWHVHIAALERMNVSIEELSNSLQIPELSGRRGNANKGQSKKGKSIWFDQDPLAGATRTRIPKSSMETVEVRGKLCIVETITCNMETVGEATKNDVASLAVQLESVEPEQSSILQCRGATRRKEGENAVFELLFRYPKGVTTQLCSFRDVLRSSEEPILGDRITLAQQLASAVFYVHDLDFVHKNIRPESILYFPKSDPSFLGDIYLGGFQTFRQHYAHTYLQQTSSIDCDLYRHPSRRGLHPDSAYRMQYDVYSLGVCLLEIGLWKSFIDYDADDTPSIHPDFNNVVEKWQDAQAVKAELILMAETQLPRRVGRHYTAVTVNCLTCLDADNLDFGDRSKLQDRDGFYVGLKYISTILNTLQKIVV